MNRQPLRYEDPWDDAEPVGEWRCPGCGHIETSACSPCLNASRHWHESHCEATA